MGNDARLINGGKREDEWGKRTWRRWTETVVMRGLSLAAPRKFVTNRHVGRNEKCPCGSGSKFKKCCLEKTK